MNSMQLSLFERRVQKADEDVSTLVAILDARREWLNRQTLCNALGWTERRLRSAGENSVGQVIFGQQGMRHICHATIGEIMACRNTLFSQARRNSERAVEIERAFHRLGRKEALA